MKSVIDNIAFLELENGTTFNTQAQQMTEGMNVLVVERNGKYIVEDIVHPDWTTRLQNNSDKND